MKKRFLSLVLALCVACSLTVPTWAAGTDWNGRFRRLGRQR